MPFETVTYYTSPPEIRAACACECHLPRAGGPDKWWGEWCCQCPA